MNLEFSLPIFVKYKHNKPYCKKQSSSDLTHIECPGDMRYII